MKSLLIVLSIVGASLAQHWGTPGVPADTPEVAAAKAAHLAALSRANQQSAPQQQSWSQPQQQQWSPPQQQWNQPQQQSRWTGPVALPPGFDQNGAPLPVQDTAEVAAERARHFNLYSSGGHPSLAPAQSSWNSATAAPQWNAQPQQQWNAQPQQQWNAQPQQQWNSQPQQQWNAPSQAGLPQDTPEVAAARAAHLAAHAALPPSSNNRRWKRSAIAIPAVSSISAYSSSIVHSTAPVVAHAPVVTPVVSHAPVITPVVATRYISPVLHASPLALAHW